MQLVGVWLRVAPQERDLNQRLTDVEYELKFNVVKKDGPLIKQLADVRSQVQELVNATATKRQIDEALAAQTKTLKRTAFNKFSRGEKLTGLFIGIGLFIVNVYEILVK